MPPRSLFLFLPLALLCAACLDGRAPHRLADLEITRGGSTETQRFSHTLAGELCEIEVSRGGAVQWTAAAAYEGGRLAGLSIVLPGGDRREVTLSHADGLLRSVAIAQGDVRADIALSYGGSRALERIEADLGGGQTYETVYAYDGEGRVSGIVHTVRLPSQARPEGLEIVTTTDVEHEGGVIARVGSVTRDNFSNSEPSEEATYRYEGGKVASIEREGGAKSALSYDGRGRLSERELPNEGRAAYTYEDGETRGFVHGWDRFFDLEGRSFPYPDPASLEMLLGLVL